MDKTPPNDTNQDAHQDAAPVDNAVFEKPDADIKKDAKREQLLLNLKKGRETALANRKKKALYNKLKKQEADEIMDNEIKQRLEKKANLENENKQLKERLLAIEMQNVAAKKEGPPPAKKPAETPNVEKPGKVEKPREKPKVVEPAVDRFVMNVFDKAPW